MSIKLFVAEPATLLRQTLIKQFQSDRDFEVVGSARDGLHLLIQMQRQRTSADIITMELSMPGMGGAETTRKLKELYPVLHVVCLSGIVNSRVIREMMEAGASGYLSKNLVYEEVKHGLKQVMEGKVFIGNHVPCRLGYAAPEVDEQQIYSSLTPRQKEIIKVLSRGCTASEMSKLLGITVLTADTHRKHIFRKTRTKNIAELTKFAIRHGIASLQG